MKRVRTRFEPRRAGDWTDLGSFGTLERSMSSKLRIAIQYMPATAGFVACAAAGTGVTQNLDPRGGS